MATPFNRGGIGLMKIMPAHDFHQAFAKNQALSWPYSIDPRSHVKNVLMAKK